MGELLIIEPIKFNLNGPAPALTVSGGTGAANLLTHDPREVWHDPQNNAFRLFNIDLGQPTELDSFYLGGTNATDAARWSITYGNNNPGGIAGNDFTLFNQAPLPLPSNDMADPVRPGLSFSQNPIIARYLNIFLFGNAATGLSVGNLIIGKALRPNYNMERGGTRVPIDSGVRTRLEDGGLTSVAGALISGFKWVFADLTEAEINKLWGIFKRTRTTEPVLVIEQSQAITAEHVHYCTFVDLEGFLREDPSKHRIAMTVEDWL